MDWLLLLIVPGACAAFALAFAEGRGWSPPYRPALHALAALGALLAVVRFAAMIAEWLPADSRVNSYDFTVFYEAALAARRWGSLYDLAGIRLDPGAIVVFRHAPIGAAIFIPLTALPFEIARNVWRFLNLALYLGVLWAVLRH